MAVTNERMVPLTSPARNRANAVWLRVKIAELRDELLRAEAYNDPQLASTEIRARLTAMLEGKEPPPR